MFIEDNIPRHKKLSGLNIQQNISFCLPLLEPVKTHFDAFGSNILLFVDKMLE